MHDIEPYYSWVKYYDAASDDMSPFYGKEYNQDLYQDAIYNYYIDPNWDYIGSETLYIKLLFVTERCYFQCYYVFEAKCSGPSQSQWN